MTDDLSQRVAKLEARVDSMEKRQDELVSRIDKLLNNELKHIDERLVGVESRGGISAKEWATIITAIIVAAGGIFVALINLLR